MAQIKAYILKLEISGIKCIKDKITIDFYKSRLSKDFRPDQYRVKAIYGGNGVGKSAIMTAVQIMKNMILSKGYLSESKNQQFLHEMINKESHAFSICCEFITNLSKPMQIHRYSLTMTEGEDGGIYIQHEELHIRSLYGQYKSIFEIENGQLQEVDSSEDSDLLRKKTMNLLSSSSFVSICISDKDIPTKIVVDLIPVLIMALTTHIYVDNEDRHISYLQRMELMRMEKEKLVGRGDLIDKMSEIVSVGQKRVLKEQFDLYQEKIKRLTTFIQLFKNDLKSIDIEKKEDGDFYSCDLNFNYGKYVVNREFESTGIKKLVRIFDVLNAGASGGIAFIDEMDANLNDIYFRAIIEYFETYGGGQLCFTSHDTEPMEALKKYKKSIDFLTDSNRLVPWVKNGNASPANAYRKGLIEYLPFNIDATDFIGVLGD